MKLWRKVRIGDIDWKVYFATPKDHPALQDLEGETDTDRGIIHVRLSGNPSLDFNTLVHELLHALLHSYGINYAMDIREDQEEKLLRVLTPALITTLENAGLLKKEVLK